MQIKKNIIIIMLFSSVILGSDTAVDDVSGGKLGIEYTGVFSGQTITEAAVPSFLRGNYVQLRYIPNSYICASIGIGSNQFSIAPYQLTEFKGKTGVSSALGLHLLTPRLFDLFSVRGGIDNYLLNSTDDSYSYLAAFVNPLLGIQFYINSFFTVEAGGKGHIITGYMSGPDKSPFRLRFSNDDYIRGFVAATLHSKNNTSYATMVVDIAREAGTDWSNGPDNVSLHFTVGFLLRQNKRSQPDEMNSPVISEMKKKQNEMADILYGEE